jgi:hypothetical protein
MDITFEIVVKQMQYLIEFRWDNNFKLNPQHFFHFLDELLFVEYT